MVAQAVRKSEDAVEMYFVNGYTDPRTDEDTEVAIDLSAMSDLKLHYLKADGTWGTVALTADGDQTASGNRGIATGNWQTGEPPTAGTVLAALEYTDGSSKPHYSGFFTLQISDSPAA